MLSFRFFCFLPCFSYFLYSLPFHFDFFSSVLTSVTFLLHVWLVLFRFWSPFLFLFQYILFFFFLLVYKSFLFLFSLHFFDQVLLCLFFRFFLINSSVLRIFGTSWCLQENLQKVSDVKPKIKASMRPTVEYWPFCFLIRLR